MQHQVEKFVRVEQHVYPRTVVSVIYCYKKQCGGLVQGISGRQFYQYQQKEQSNIILNH
jgi:hypothetical protein